MTSELDNRNIAVSMRKSVENLVISSQDAIGQGLTQALNFSGVLTQHANQIISGQENRSVSRSPSPSLRIADTTNIEVIDSDKQNDLTIQVPTHGAGDSISLGSQGDGIPLALGTKSSDCQGKNAGTPGTLAKGTEGSRSKKKSWYSSYLPTYKSRSDDFKRLFKDLPNDERLIVDYSCALQKDILAQGRLYASQNYLCFYANIFGWETSMSLRWKDVTAITKEKTARVIPNAILVCTDSEKNFLTSFSGRDKAYLMLFRVWQNALMDQPMSNQEIWQWVHSCYGEELGFNSDEEGYAREDDDKSAVPALTADNCSEYFLESSSMEVGVDDGEDRLDTTTARTNYGRSVSQPPENIHTGVAVDGEAGCDEGGGEDGDVLPTDMSDTSDTDHEKHNGVEVERCTLNHEGKQFIKAEIPINIDQMFTMIFTNSKFNLELLAARGASDYIQASWQNDPLTGLKCRQISYTIGLSSGPIGPKEVYVTETQVMNKCSKPGVMYSIDATSDNAGIPYAEHFSVFAHYCLRRLSDSTTSLTMHSHIKYKKSVWPFIRGFLDKNALGGVEEFAGLLESRLVMEAEHAPKRKARRRRRPISLSQETAVAVVSSSSPRRSSLPRPSLPPPSSRGWWPSVLLLLLLINGLLYWRLYHAAERGYGLDDLQNRMSSLSAEHMSEWSRLLEQHTREQRGELQKWRDALGVAVDTLRRTEHAVSDLLVSLKPSLEKAQKEAADKLHTEL